MCRFLKIPSIFIFILLSSCQSDDTSSNEIIEVIAEFEELESRINANPEKLWVVNFWATTCKPCLQEMPHFNELEKSYKNLDIKVLLVSLDKSDQLESKVYKFVKKHQIQPEVNLLSDPNYNVWTEKIDREWYGALPATIIIKGEKRKFRFGMYESFDELIQDLKEVNLM